VHNAPARTQGTLDMNQCLGASRALLALALAGLIGACATPNRLVYSSGFSFANYDYVFLAKPEGANANTALYGFDVEFGNILTSYNMRLVGDKQFAAMPTAQQQRTLFARMAVAGVDERIVFSVSFDDATSGRTGANITSSTKGELFEEDDRREAFESVSNTVIRALQQDKGLLVSEHRASRPEAGAPAAPGPAASAPMPPEPLPPAAAPPGEPRPLTDDASVVPVAP
jgi:hypothetical protein